MLGRILMLLASLVGVVLSILYNNNLTSALFGCSVGMSVTYLIFYNERHENNEL